MRSAVSSTARHQLDKRTTGSARMAPPPHAGWLRATRDALGISAAALASRLNITSAAVSQAEKSEAMGTMRLETLRRFADAMDCDVVYYLEPRLGSLQATYDAQVDRAVRQLATRVGQTMALENQGTVNDVSRREKLRNAVIEAGNIW